MANNKFNKNNLCYENHDAVSVSPNTSNSFNFCCGFSNLRKERKEC
jgi:hypothetical protein